MKFARNVFLIAGIYGIVIILPMYFMEETLNAEFPPAITHPEYYYGFLGVTLAWQILFLLIARDPAKFRIMMIPAIFEKVFYVVAIFWLALAGRVVAAVISGAIVDLALAVLFLLSYLRTKPQAEEAS